MLNRAVCVLTASVLVYVMSASVSVAAKFSAEPAALGFRNNMKVGEEETKPVTLTNISGGPLTANEALFVNGTIFKVAEPKTCLKLINNGGTCEIQVTFKPTAEEVDETGAYKLEPNAAGGPWVVVNFTGATLHKC